MADIPFAWADDRERISQVIEGEIVCIFVHNHLENLTFLFPELLELKLMPIIENKGLKRKATGNGKEANAKRPKIK